MAKKIDISGAPFVKGARYPMPYDEPCAPRQRWRLGDAARRARRKAWGSGRPSRTAHRRCRSSWPWLLLPKDEGAGRKLERR